MSKLLKKKFGFVIHISITTYFLYLCIYFSFTFKFTKIQPVYPPYCIWEPRGTESNLGNGITSGGSGGAPMIVMGRFGQTSSGQPGYSLLIQEEIGK